MPRGQRVSDDELEGNSYIDDMLGTNEGADIDVDVDGDEGGDQGTQETDKGQTQRNERQPAGGNDKGNQQQQQQQGKQPGKKQAGGKQPGTDGSVNKGQQQQQGKINLTREDQLQVYKAVQQRMQPVIDALDIKLKKASRELEVYQARDAVFSEFKLSPKEHLNAVQLAVALRTKPKETLEYLIGQAQANGLQIAVGNGQAGLTPQAIQQMLDQRLAPLTRQAQESEAQSAALQEAEEQIGMFYGKYPDARVHETAIDQILQRNPQLDLMDAYVRLRSYFSDNGLDWNVPLETHAQHAQQAGGKGQRKQQNGRPLNVRGVGNSIQNDQENAEEPEMKIADVGTSTRSIIRNAMRQAGLDLNRLN